PEGEGKLAAEVLQAAGAVVLVEVQGDLAVGSRAEAVAPPLQVAAESLEVVELAVDGDPPRAVLAGDRLVAGGQVDDAEPGVPEPGPAAVGDPDPLAVGAAVGEPPGGVLQGLGVD